MAVRVRDIGKFQDESATRAIAAYTAGLISKAQAREMLGLEIDPMILLRERTAEYRRQHLEPRTCVAFSLGTNYDIQLGQAIKVAVGTETREILVTKVSPSANGETKIEGIEVETPTLRERVAEFRREHLLA